jgi:hypothetical protein
VLQEGEVADADVGRDRDRIVLPANASAGEGPCTEEQAHEKEVSHEGTFTCTLMKTDDPDRPVPAGVGGFSGPPALQVPVNSCR